MNSHQSAPPGSGRQLLGYKLARTNFYQRSLLQSLFKKYDVSITNEQWVVMKIIAGSPGLSQTEIARRSLKDKTNITRILDVLDKSGHIERHRSTTDRRRFEIRLTKKGDAALETVSPAMVEGESILHSGLTPTEVEKLKQLLDKVASGIQKAL